MALALSPVEFLSDLGVPNDQPEYEKRNGKGKILQIMKSPAVHVIALLMFVYVGAEFTIGSTYCRFIVYQDLTRLNRYNDNTSQ